MPTASWIEPLRRAAFASALAAAMTCATGAVRAQQAQAPAPDDDDEYSDSILNADKRMVNKVLNYLGLGLQNPGIDYRERSPLVVPPARDLPPPAERVAKNPDWPLDPEVKERREEKAARKANRTSDPSKSIAGTPDSARTAKSSKWDDGDKPIQEPDFIQMIRSGRFSRVGAKEETGTFKGEPPRTSLVEPPPGYLTPSPTAPYGFTDRPYESYEKDKDTKP